MKRTQKTLIVDDEHLAMRGYVNELKAAAFDVKQCFDPDKSLKYVRDHYFSIIAIVLDIMLPAGERFRNENTMNGLITGLHLYRDLKSRCPRVPFLFLTNVPNDVLSDILDRFDDVPREMVVHKMECKPAELVRMLRNLLQKSGQFHNLVHESSPAISSEGVVRMHRNGPTRRHPKKRKRPTKR